MNTKKMKSKIAGAVYGFAIGDAMGATTEFMSAEQIEKRYGRVVDIIGGGWLCLKPGEVTDDTQMMMCVMDAAMASGGDLDAFRKFCIDNFIEWYKNNPPDVGGQCARGIQALQIGTMAGSTTSAGNGSLMRALPCALLGWKEHNFTQGVLTHLNKECVNAISWYHNAIQETLNGTRKWESFKHPGECLKQPTGYVKNTFINAMIWASEATFGRCIIGAVNHGGDADTIAAIAGGLSGARFGYEAIPQKWIDKLDPQVKTKLDEFIEFCVCVKEARQ